MNEIFDFDIDEIIKESRIIINLLIKTYNLRFSASSSASSNKFFPGTIVESVRIDDSRINDDSIKNNVFTGEKNYFIIF